MSLKKFPMMAVAALAFAVLTACSSIAAHHNSLFAHEGTAPASVSQPADEQIAGDWSVTFHVHEMKTPATFSFALDGTKLTGTAFSDHTGAGTIRDGNYANGKFSFTLDFKKHESIAVTGVLKDGKLTGEFTTEGFTDKWEAVRK
jgi:hypothetical protein